MQRLVTYTKTHFRNEEELMNKNNYVLLDDHKKEHQKFVDEIEALLKKYESGSVAITIELLNYLKIGWSIIFREAIKNLGIL
ncbi:MAG: hemerythrin domain-containing protein [Melioribacteraceae bacterium]|nr:hemerythrin domain-containing protein [Melioribacteraceae bacterium]